MLPGHQEVAQRVLDGMSPGDAALQVGYQSPDTGNYIMRRPEVQSAMIQAMEQRGITRNLLAKKMKQGLRATTKIYHHGQLIDEIDDHGTRHKYLTTALDVFGDTKPKNSQESESFEELIFQIHARRRISP
jgi:hypothetical protein